MGGLSLKFKTEARSAEALNFNERPSTRLLCCLYTNHTVVMLFIYQPHLCCLYTNHIYVVYIPTTRGCYVVYIPTTFSFVLKRFWLAFGSFCLLDDKRE